MNASPGAQKLKQAVCILSAASLAALLLSDPPSASASALRGLRSALAVIPAVFPYLVLSEMLFSSGLSRWTKGRAGRLFSRVFRLPPSGLAVLLIGLVSGFPVGAKCAASLYKRGECSAADAERMAAFCDFCAPPFLIFAVGQGIFSSPAVGWTIYAFQTLFALLFGFFLRRPKNPARGARICFADDGSSAVPLSRAIADATVRTLNICGCLLFFSMTGDALARPLGALFARFPIVKPLFFGFFEMSSGVFAIGSGGVRGLFEAVLIVTFSGLSVYMQTATFLKAEGLSARGYLAAHLLCPCFVFPFSLLFLKMCGFFS